MIKVINTKEMELNLIYIKANHEPQAQHKLWVSYHRTGIQGKIHHLGPHVLWWKADPVKNQTHRKKTFIKKESQYLSGAI